MHTDSPKLIGSAAYVGQRAWQECQESFEWSNSDFDAVFCHQVGKQLGDTFFKTMGVDNSKEFSIYRTHGNQVSAALPSTMIHGVESGYLTPGSKALLTGFGSGLNAIFTAVSW
jgi:3-oxoacyl-[acyl-carrier-protein] synthase-3